MSGAVALEIAIEVAYAERDRQTLIALRVPAGTTAEQAVVLSRIRERHAGIPPDAALGVHGRVVARTQVLAAGDRVELYRPLPADPKDTRRRLAREGRTMGVRAKHSGAKDAGSEEPRTKAPPRDDAGWISPVGRSMRATFSSSNQTTKWRSCTFRVLPSRR